MFLVCDSLLVVFLPSLPVSLDLYKLSTRIDYLWNFAIRYPGIWLTVVILYLVDIDIFDSKTVDADHMYYLPSIAHLYVAFEFSYPIYAHSTHVYP